jgi:hypothetical protein
LRFGLSETSEKTTEINTLSDLASFIERFSRRKVTIICPTQNDEKHLGFDEIIEELPAGQVVAFQFKRPLPTRRDPACTRFILDTEQLQSLLDNFYPAEAYYVLVPYPLNADIVLNRNTLLQDADTVDAYDIPHGRKVSQGTRTIRHYRRVDAHGNRNSEIEVTDPLTYETIERKRSLQDLAKRFMEGEIGIRHGENVPKKEQKKKIRLRKLYYVHLSSQESLEDKTVHFS